LIFRSRELTAHLGGELIGSDVGVEGPSIDSRTILPGQLYVPIVAERDGHAYIPAALEAGASAYLTAQEPVGGTAIRVRDTAAALLSLGALARGRVGGAIAVTGSVGKTTTKDLLAACLASAFRTAASKRSFNNELGLPLTLLNAAEAGHVGGGAVSSGGSKPVSIAVSGTPGLRRQRGRRSQQLLRLHAQPGRPPAAAERLDSCSAGRLLAGRRAVQQHRHEPRRRAREHVADRQLRGRPRRSPHGRP
jgi:hypothetical protein